MNSTVSRSETVCPIPGCNFHYATAGARGWLKHVGKIASHPFWQSAVTDPVQRVELYRKEFLPVVEEVVPVEVPAPALFPAVRRRMPMQKVIAELVMMRDKIASLLEDESDDDVDNHICRLRHNRGT